MNSFIWRTGTLKDLSFIYCCTIAQMAVSFSVIIEQITEHRSTTEPWKDGITSEGGITDCDEIYINAKLHKNKTGHQIL